MKSVEVPEQRIGMRTGAQDPEGMSVPPRRPAQGGSACTLVVPTAL